MKISVIIPTFNRPHLLKKCLDALATQEFQEPFEVIVVSDGPDEHTARYIAALNHPYIKHCQLDRHRGPAAARNAGVALSKGRLLVFTDDDTVPDAGWLRHFARAIDTVPQRAAAITGKVVVPVSAEPTDFELNTAGLETAQFVTANCAVTREAFAMCGGFDEDFTMAWHEDSDLHFKILKKNIPLLRCEQAIVIHPVRKVSWDVSIRAEKKNMFNALLYKRHPEIYKQMMGTKPRWQYYAMVACMLTAYGATIAGNKKLSYAALIPWLLLTGAFIWKRLARSRKSPEHIAQMMITSALIPFYSVFWKMYGSVKFKKLLL